MSRFGKLIRGMLREWFSPVFAERETIQENRYCIVIRHIMSGHTGENELYTALQKESLENPDLKMTQYALCRMLRDMERQGLISGFDAFTGDPSRNGYERRYEVTVRNAHIPQTQISQ